MTRHFLWVLGSAAWPQSNLWSRTGQGATVTAALPEHQLGLDPTQASLPPGAALTHNPQAGDMAGNAQGPRPTPHSGPTAPSAYTAACASGARHGTGDFSSASVSQALQ